MEGQEEKRSRMKWTPHLDEKFNKIIRYLGEKATPIPILKLMNHPKLTRKQVENHLQKYRVRKRQAQLVQPISSSIVNQSKITSQTPPSLVPENHSNVLNSNDFLINFNKSYLPQSHTVPSLVPPNNFFTGLDDLIQNLELDLNIKMTENQINTYFNMDNENHSNVLKTKEFTMNFNELLQETYLPQLPINPSLFPSNDLFTRLKDPVSSSSTQDNISTRNHS